MPTPLTNPSQLQHQPRMYSTLIVFAVAFIACANAFRSAPSSRTRAATQMNSKYANAIGAQAPLGFWDPLGLLKDADQEKFDRLRKVETKHGRIAMLAVLGHIVTAKGDRFTGEIAYGIKFSDVKPGLGALSTIPMEGIAQIMAFIGLIEFGFANIEKPLADWCMSSENTLFKWDEKTRNRKLAIELNNGRAAQMGILGLMVHEKLNNDPYVLNSILGSPVPGFN